MQRPVREQFRDVFDTVSLSLFENVLDHEQNTVMMHYHDRLEIIHVLEGEGVVSVNLKEHEITAGDIVLLAPDEIHSVKGKKGGFVHCQTLVFQSDPFGLRGEYGLETLIGKGQPGNEKMCTLHSLVFDLRNTGLGEAQKVVEGILAALCGLITYHRYFVPEPVSLSSSAAALRGVLRYMREHFAEKLEVDTLAGIAGYSKYHFIRFFSKSTGYTCVRYLHMLRLQQAKKLLRETDYRLEQVGELSGFESVSYLIRIFKREEGITPYQYRKQKRNAGNR